MKRSYRQNCALANALDRVGERWTLLIVRELLTGPRRYGELGENLAGMGTNLLASRLKDMLASGLVQKEAGHYSLTESGKLLEPVVHALVRFGMSLDLAPDEAWLHRPEWDAVALKALYRPDQDLGLRGRYVFDIDGESFCVDKSPARLLVTREHCEDPVASVSLDKKTGRDMAAGRLSLEQAESKGLLVLGGDRQQAMMLLSAFQSTGA